MQMPFANNMMGEAERNAAPSPYVKTVVHGGRVTALPPAEAPLFIEPKQFPHCFLLRRGADGPAWGELGRASSSQTTGIVQDRCVADAAHRGWRPLFASRYPVRRPRWRRARKAAPRTVTPRPAIGQNAPLPKLFAALETWPRSTAPAGCSSRRVPGFPRASARC
jgi:hypothetical protein